MDQFRTEVLAPEFPFAIDHQSKVFSLGSCFSVEMGQKLFQNKFQTHINPFGILFNPFSIMNALERMLNERGYTEQELLQSDEHWVSLDHHGSFKNLDKEACLAGINDALVNGAERLKIADVILITLGSSWVYEHQERKHIVANCHKIPNHLFHKKLLSQQDVHLILRHIPQFLFAKGIDSQIVFTVSPVRHWKDGPIQNSRSKAQLLSGIHAVCDEFENCHYFPSYELMIDDLRDYRFYANDMLHPSPQAIDYIWDRFQESFFSDETRIICKEIQSVVQAANHRPMDPESNSFQRFLSKQLSIISGLEEKYPSLDLTDEKEKFSRYLLKS